MNIFNSTERYKMESKNKTNEFERFLSLSLVSPYWSLSGDYFQKKKYTSIFENIRIPVYDSLLIDDIKFHKFLYREIQRIQAYTHTERWHPLPLSQGYSEDRNKNTWKKEVQVLYHS